MYLKLSNNVLVLEGVFTKENVPSAEKELSKLLKSSIQEQVTMIDLGGIESLDSAGVSFLDEVHQHFGQKSGILLFRGAKSEVQAVIDTFTTINLPIVAANREMGTFEQLGHNAIAFYYSMIEALTLASEIFYYSAVGLFNAKSRRKGSTIQQAALLGSQALPIVALLSFIIGFILSLQSGVQLKNFGAGVFLADLLAITMVREMGPLITSIIVAGRSGSAIASEIATMQVTEELDALRMMSLHPIRFVVVPKFHAITFVMPILVMFSILVAEIGGGLIALVLLDTSMETFIDRSIEIISIKDIIISFGKSIWFAWVIVIVGSYYGFQVKGGAEGVGRATTAAVVSSIFAVILFDAVFSLLYL
ncbi:MAG: MlaE family lipid ABC transporter permease subunit [Candidatus Cloacimonetes bacterium]|nr:MlaE family lipid ABC transporter permease subunit [Candidatus Cloacimonadota bacterium]MDD4232330.1 MlaE family lipid ABC transporter permease subunit [Candidatus Cloacimonadota bacterium]